VRADEALAFPQFEPVAVDSAARLAQRRVVRVGLDPVGAGDFSNAIERYSR